MQYFFEYNWQVRAEWFDLCRTIPNDELYAKRTGGVGSIAYTLFHIIIVEHDWICDLQQEPILERNFEEYQNFSAIIQLSRTLHSRVNKFLEGWNAEMENEILNLDFGNGAHVYCTYGEALRHIIAHEIHHIGQLSIWAREIGIAPISANLIHRGIFIDNKR